MKSYSSLRLLALLLGGTFALTSSTCGGNDDPQPTPATNTAQTVELRFSVTGTKPSTNTTGSTGPNADLFVLKVNGPGQPDSTLFSSWSQPGWSVQIPDGNYTRTLTRRFKKGETFVVRSAYRFAGTNQLRPDTNLHVEAWSGSTMLGATDLGYADRNNTTLWENQAPPLQDLVRRVTITIP